jgi:hypothetical protein
MIASGLCEMASVRRRPDRVLRSAAPETRSILRARNASGKDGLDSEPEAGRRMLVRLPSVHGTTCLSARAGRPVAAEDIEKGVAPGRRRYRGHAASLRSGVTSLCRSGNAPRIDAEADRRPHTPSEPGSSPAIQNLENALQGRRIKVATDVNAASPDVDGDEASALLATCKGGLVVMAPGIGHQRGIPQR